MNNFRKFSQKEKKRTNGKHFQGRDIESKDCLPIQIGISDENVGMTLHNN